MKQVVKRFLIYLTYVAVFLGSLALSYYLPEDYNKIVSIIIAFPAIGAVIGFMSQLFRDQLAHDRQLYRDDLANDRQLYRDELVHNRQEIRDQQTNDRQLYRDELSHDRQIIRDETSHIKSMLRQQDQNTFTLGATSNMATTAFTNYVNFCQEYIEEMYGLLGTLIREGPTSEALGHTSKLAAIRRKWALWLTSDVESTLDKFEASIRRIGSTANLKLQSSDDETRKVLLDDMYKRFAEVIGLDEWNNKPVNKDVAIPSIISKLRDVLGIKELNAIRSSLIIDPCLNWLISSHGMATNNIESATTGRTTA